MSKILAYHFLKSDMCSHAGHEPPWKEGETRTLDGEIGICAHGYHASRTAWDALQFAPGPVLCLVEVEPVEEHTEKLVSRSRRLIKAVNVERELREFAADCAERVLHFYEEAYPGDQRPRAAIATARAYARGEATDGELNAAARAAADAAADAAYAARAAVRAAVDVADAERRWQREQFNVRLAHLFATEIAAWNALQGDE